MQIRQNLRLNCRQINTFQKGLISLLTIGSYSSELFEKTLFSNSSLGTDEGRLRYRLHIDHMDMKKEENPHILSYNKSKISLTAVQIILIFY